MKAATLLESREPARIVVLSPSTWTADPKAPTSDIAVGIRCLSHSEIMTAKAEATKEATAPGRRGQDAAERYGEALMSWTVGFGVCDPNDPSKPFFPCGDEDARRKLTPEGLRRLWDEIEQAHIESSPLRPEATDDELEDLALLMTDPEAWQDMPRGDVARLRRLLRFALDCLQPKA